MYRLSGIDFEGGVAIWHIDEAQRATQNDDETHKLVDLEEAAGFELDSGGGGNRNNLFYRGNSMTFNNDSTPNSKKYDGSSSNINISNISAVGVAADNFIMTLDIQR